MKLKTFNRKDCQFTISDNKPRISFEKSGIIRLNRKLCAELKIKVGDKINILQDEESPRDWYLEKTRQEKGLVMRKQNENNLCCNAKVIVSQINSSLGLENKSIRFVVSTKPAVDETDIYAIITRDL